MGSNIIRYELYMKSLKSQGFMVNSYNRYKAKITIDDRQCKIAFYVDDNKVSHIDEDITTRIIEAKAEMFGELSILRGKRTSS